MRNLCLMLGLLALSACIGGKPDAPKENPITGAAIAVTPLDGPAGDSAPPAIPPVPVPAAGTPGQAAATPTPALTVQVPPPAPPSPEEAACTKTGGTWASTGGKLLHSCVHVTKDAGKQCSRGTQCEGLCLARSGTCSPVAPLFGCNEIFQDNGARVTLCID